MNETKTRIRSLWQLSIKLRKITEDENWQAPFGSEAKAINKQLDAMCDEIERLVWQLGGTPHAKS